MLFQKKKHETVDEFGARVRAGVLPNPAPAASEDNAQCMGGGVMPTHKATRRAGERETLELLRDLIGSANSLPHLKEAIEQRLAESEQE